MTTENKLTWLEDPDYWKYVFRLKGYAQDARKVGAELLEAALEGRAKTRASILKIFEIASRSFSNEANHAVVNQYWDACREFLVADAADAKELKDLRADRSQPKYGDRSFVSVLDEMRRGNPAALLALNFDITAAMARITGLYDPNRPGLVPANKQWSLEYATEVLETALGDKLNQGACRILWQAVEALPAAEDGEKPAAARAIAMCVCKVANTKQWDVRGEVS